MVEWSPQQHHHTTHQSIQQRLHLSPFPLHLHSTTMNTTVDPGGFRRRDDLPEFNLREWDLQANRISRQNTNSRRFSASNINSFREDITRRSSFRSNFTISSTASSPGYPLMKDEIDPSTYSFTTALKALQAKSGFYNNLDCLSPEGFALHSKWNDAEKYICNPQSGQVPMECLSARSFRNLQSRMTMSAPLVYNFAPSKIPSLTVRESDLLQNVVIKENKERETTTATRDVGIQFGRPAVSSSSSSLSPASTPSIQDRAPKLYGVVGGESSNSSAKLKSEVEVEMRQENHEEKKDSDKETSDSDCSNDRQHIRRCGPYTGCLSWKIVRKHQTPNTKSSKKSNLYSSFTSFKKR